jgi:hypothetical protein
VGHFVKKNMMPYLHLRPSRMKWKKNEKNSQGSWIKQQLKVH